MDKTPIALFTYNRAEHVDRALASLSRCARLDECVLYIYCDGPKGPEQTNAVRASREKVAGWASKLGATVTERAENLGLARSIVSGVTDLCGAFGRVIVLEDDLVVTPDFLNYMLSALDRYKDEPRVYQVSGYMHPVSHPLQPDAFFMPMTTTWGWATWIRAWHIFDSRPKGVREWLAEPETRRRFNLNDTFPLAQMMESNLAGHIDSWGILWWYAVFRAGGLVIHPRTSLVYNAGFDGTGVHCGKLSSNFCQPRLGKFGESRLSKSIVFPDRIAPDEEAFSRVKEFLKSQTFTTKPYGITKLLSTIKKHAKNLFDRDER